MAFQKKKKVQEVSHEEEFDELDDSELVEEDDNSDKDGDGFYDDDYEKDDFLDESYDDFDIGIRNQADVVKIWLDTEPYLNNIYLSITNQQLKRIKVKMGGKSSYKTEILPIKYSVVENNKKVEKTLEPLANNLGVSQIMAELKVFLSSPLVQGNLSDDRYRTFMLWYEEQVTCMLWSNRQIWGISLHDVQPIYNKIVGSVGLFLTRPLGNLERGRDKWNPNNRPGMDAEKGFIDKLAFWRKSKKMDTGSGYS